MNIKKKVSLFLTLVFVMVMIMPAGSVLATTSHDGSIQSEVYTSPKFKLQCVAGSVYNGSIIDEVYTSQYFTVNVWLENGQDIYAEDFIFSYDTDLFNYIGHQIVKEGLRLYAEDRDPAGVIRYIVVSEGRGYGISEDSILISLNFRASGYFEGLGTFGVNGVVADKNGYEYFATDELGIYVKPSTPSNTDVNRDGKNSVGDLAIAAYNFGQPNYSWSNQNSDVNKDGNVNNIDLSEIVEAILRVR
ncbi:MAG: hypothetical protein MJA84_11840 [Firmicutes bacterium]|nr:hypothetical protein [Bacillota bacterium]